MGGGGRISVCSPIQPQILGLQKSLSLSSWEYRCIPPSSTGQDFIKILFYSLIIMLVMILMTSSRFLHEGFFLPSLEETKPKNIQHNILVSVQQAVFRHTLSSSPLTMLFNHTWDYFLTETSLLCANSEITPLLCRTFIAFDTT